MALCRHKVRKHVVLSAHPRERTEARLASHESAVARQTHKDMSPPARTTTERHGNAVEGYRAGHGHGQGNKPQHAQTTSSNARLGRSVVVLE